MKLICGVKKMTRIDSPKPFGYVLIDKDTYAQVGHPCWFETKRDRAYAIKTLRESCRVTAKTAD